MIDFLKLDISYLDENKLLENNLLEFKKTVNHKTNEISYPYQANYHNFKFVINRKSKILNGSIHKYWNCRNDLGMHNWNDFSYDNLLEVIEDLRRKFGINPELTTIQNIEYGVNIIIDIDPSDFIEKIVVYNGRLPNLNSNYERVSIRATAPCAIPFLS